MSEIKVNKISPANPANPIELEGEVTFSGTAEFTATTVTGNYTIPSGGITVNVNAASATITLPAATVVGRRVTVRKVSASAGTVTVSRASTDTITRAALTSVTLTSNGDFWTLEVVASGRWDLVDGFETIDSGTIDGIKRHDGTMEQRGSDVASPVATDNISGTGTFASAFSDAPVMFFSTTNFGVDHVFSMGNGRAFVNNDRPSATAYKWFLKDVDSIARTATFNVLWHAIGRWYT